MKNKGLLIGLSAIFVGIVSMVIAFFANTWAIVLLDEVIGHITMFEIKEGMLQTIDVLICVFASIVIIYAVVLLLGNGKMLGKNAKLIQIIVVLLAVACAVALYICMATYVKDNAIIAGGLFSGSRMSVGAWSVVIGSGLFMLMAIGQIFNSKGGAKKKSSKAKSKKK